MATLREARRQYFQISGFDETTYTATSIPVRLGPISFKFPNPAWRRKTVPLHDLHHIVTGYGTTLLGEAEVSAWEIAAGGTPRFVIRILIYAALTAGLFINPMALWRAYQRGRGSTNLFKQDFSDALLDVSVGEMRRRLNVREA